MKCSKGSILVIVLGTTIALYAPPTTLAPLLYASVKVQNPLASTASLGFLTYAKTASWLQKKALTAPQNRMFKADPQTTIFAFDLHHVMVKPDYSKILRIVWCMPGKTSALTHFINPWFLYDFIKLCKDATFEELVITLAKKYQTFGQAQSSLFAIANAQKPIWGTIQIIKELKERGFKIYLLSNIGQKMFTEFKQMHPELFEYFDYFFVSSPDYNYIHKPNVRMFDIFLQKYHLEPNNVVFIDDLPVNIKAAMTVGLHGILFSSVAQLRNDLEQIGALPASTPHDKEFVALSSLVLTQQIFSLT